jgi:hypothetical protein
MDDLPQGFALPRAQVQQEPGSYIKPPPGIPDDAEWRYRTEKERGLIHGCALANGWDGVSDDPSWIDRTPSPWPGYRYDPETWRSQWGDVKASGFASAAKSWEANRREEENTRLREENRRIVAGYVTSNKMIEWSRLPYKDQQSKEGLKLKAEGAADLKKAREPFEAAGYLIIDRDEGFVALGIIPEQAEPVDRWGGWHRWPRGDDGDTLEAIGCDDEQLKLLDFQAPTIREHDDGAFFQVLSYDGVSFEIPAQYALGPDEPFSALLEKLPLLPFTNAELEDFFEDAGGDPWRAAKMMELERAARGLIDEQKNLPMLVAGLLPLGEVVVFLGAGEAGKSTLAHQFACAVTSGQPDIFGLEIAPPDQGRGTAAIVAAEDPGGVIKNRMIAFRQGGLSGRVLPVLQSPDRDLKDELSELENWPNLRLVIVDPLGVWMGAGADENDARHMNAAHAICQSFARRSGVTVLLIHHTGKAAPKKTAAHDLRFFSRGSNALMDRARVVLGLVLKANGTSVLAVSKSNIPGIKSGFAVTLTRDPETLLHHAAGTAPGARVAAAGRRVAGVAAAGGMDDAGTAVAALARLVAAGQTVTRTGKRSLHAHVPEEVAGWSRRRVEGAVDAALAAGMVVADASGSLSPAAVPVPSVPITASGDVGTVTKGR